MLINQISSTHNTASIKNNSIEKKEFKSKKKVETDKLELSVEAKERILKDEEITKDREEKVARIKESIKNGTYKVDSSKIAESILKYFKE